uniref:Peptidase A2 domain-containing protein n=1 Tax=Romanomermis culicivorax TaxID=13658 RepID=A0A915HS40_ROMCU
MDTGAQCSVLFSGLVKPAFDKQLLQLPICRKIKVADGAIITTHGPVVFTIESTFGEHMIKCVILDKDNDQEKPPIPSTEDLATKIFCPKYPSTGAVSDVEPRATNEVPPPTEIGMDINAITRSMTRKPINQPTLFDPVLLAANHSSTQCC